MEEQVKAKQPLMPMPLSQTFRIPNFLFFILSGTLIAGLYVGLIIGRNNNKTSITTGTVATPTIQTPTVLKDKDGWQRTEFKSSYSEGDELNGKFSLSYPTDYCTLKRGVTNTIQCQKGKGSFSLDPQAGGRGADVQKVDENVPLGNYRWTRIDFGGVTYGMDINQIYYLIEVEYVSPSQELRTLAEEIIATFEPIK